MFIDLYFWIHQHIPGLLEKSPPVLLSSSVFFFLVSGLVAVCFRSRNTECRRCRHLIADQSAPLCPECGAPLHPHGIRLEFDGLGYHRWPLRFSFVLLILAFGMTMANANSHGLVSITDSVRIVESNTEPAGPVNVVNISVRSICLDDSTAPNSRASESIHSEFHLGAATHQGVAAGYPPTPPGSDPAWLPISQFNPSETGLSLAILLGCQPSELAPWMELTGAILDQHQPGGMPWQAVLPHQELLYLMPSPVWDINQFEIPNLYLGGMISAACLGGWMILAWAMRSGRNPG